MKVSSLLAHYLYERGQLELPGIGRFFLEEAGAAPDLSDKNQADLMTRIRFSQETITKADPALIEYIRQKTGKITPLAQSDLESFLDLGKELLNISKPFQVEGIGTLTKNKDAQFEFFPALQAAEASANERQIDRPSTRPIQEYESEFTKAGPSENPARRLLLFLGILVGLALIIGGGYFLYSRSTSEPKENLVSEQNKSQQDQAQPSNDPQPSVSGVPGATDSVHSVPDNPPTPATATPGTYKFIFETTHRRRALSRFAQVHELSPRIQMETPDSTNFRIYVILPSSIADTSWKKDSLKAWYWGTRPNQITIDHQYSGSHP